MLVHKYRPTTFENFQGNEEIVTIIKNLLEKDKFNLPHMLFTGPYGCGKTTLSYIIAYQIYGDDVKQYLYEFNGSAENGIDFVRQKITEIVTKKSRLRKLIFIDEFDKFSKDAQDSLRFIMEKYQQNALFIVSCNYIQKIIGAMKSRFKVFTFKPLDYDSMGRGLVNIIERENIEIDEDKFEKIIESSKGDLRTAIQMLEGVAVGEQIEIVDIDINDTTLSEFIVLATQVNPKVLLDNLFEIVINKDKKYNLLPEFGECDYRIAVGANQTLQLQELFYKVKKEYDK